MRLRIAMVAAFAMGAACLCGGAQAQTQTPCDAFVKNADGTWTATRNVAMPAAGRAFSIRAGAVLRPGAAFAGMDFASMLEQDCPAAVQTQAEVAKQVEVTTYADANGDIDVQKLTCGQLANTHQEDTDVLAIWYVGWRNGLAKKHAINVSKVRAGIPNVIAYCKTNKDKLVVQAIDVVMKEDRR